MYSTHQHQINYFIKVKCFSLTHLPLVPHICLSQSCQHWFRQWLGAYSAPSHYLNQCWVIVNGNLKNKFKWNLNQNTRHFIHENALKFVVYEMAKWRPFCQKHDKCMVQTESNQNNGKQKNYITLLMHTTARGCWQQPSWPRGEVIRSLERDLKCPHVQYKFDCPRETLYHLLSKSDNNREIHLPSLPAFDCGQ